MQYLHEIGNNVRRLSKNFIFIDHSLPINIVNNKNGKTTKKEGGRIECSVVKCQKKDFRHRLCTRVTINISIFNFG